PELRFSYFAELADLVLQAARRHDLVVLIEQTNGDRAAELALLRSPRISMMDGLLFSPLGMSHEDAGLIAADYPLVLLGERVFSDDYDHVTIQNVDAARDATAFLLDGGRKRIALLGAHEGEVVGSAAFRYAGYREALAAAGVPLDPSLVIASQGWHRTDGATAMRVALERGARFDGLFALNDELALGALRVLQAAGLRVPEDVAVVGFDNLDEGQYAMPSLTTVDPGRPAIAQAAVDSLVERIAAGVPESGAGRRIEAPYRLIVRESADFARVSA
ncbi:MAG TPA: substrate-binding domain-containing protein, partial [Naasia sp.]